MVKKPNCRVFFELSAPTEFWRETKSWPSRDRTGRYVFLLEAVCRYGEHRHAANWKKIPGYFRVATGHYIPDEMAKATREHRLGAHYLLRSWCFDYVPKWRPDFEFIEDTGGRVELETGYYEFTETEWKAAVTTCCDGPGPWNFYPYDQIVEEVFNSIADAAAKGKLATFARTQEGGFERIDDHIWNEGLEVLKPFFAFGRINLLAPKSVDVPGTHWIFVSENDLSVLIRNNEVKTDAHSAAMEACIQSLVIMMKESKIATKAAYREEAHKVYGGTITVSNFDNTCWPTARKTGLEHGADAVHPSWDRPGPRRGHKNTGKSGCEGKIKFFAVGEIKMDDGSTRK